MSFIKDLLTFPVMESIKINKFDFSVIADDFDDHISKSIRGYGDLFEDILSYSSCFIKDGSRVLDIGCSTGKLLKSIVSNNLTKQISATGVEIERAFAKYHNSDLINFIYDDFAQFDCDLKFDFISSVFTLQFMNFVDRINALRKIYSLLNSGCGFIFCEKTTSENEQLNKMQEAGLRNFKKESFSNKEIIDKARRLKSSLHLMTVQAIFDELSSVGFGSVEIIWKQHAFAAFLAIK